MTNGKHRARWLADIISETQRYLSKAREAPEANAVRQALTQGDGQALRAGRRGTLRPVGAELRRPGRPRCDLPAVRSASPLTKPL